MKIPKLPKNLKSLVWKDSRGLRHTKFVEKHHEIPKEIIKKLKFRPYKLLGVDEDYSFKVYPPLNAGDVLKLKNGKYVLVGHVNKNLGVCVCRNFEEKDIKEIASLF